MLPGDFGPWKTVYHVFRKWVKLSFWSKLNDRLRRLVRKLSGKEAQATAAMLDSQSVKSSAHGGEVGYDAAKKIKGRKRHMLVDTLGMLLGVWVTPADTPERDGGIGVIGGSSANLCRLRKLWVDNGYSGDQFAEGVRDIRPQIDTEVVRRPISQKGFKLLPKRWVVERTFGWLMQNRRLVRDYEKTTTSAEAFIYLTMIGICLRRLA